MMILSIDLISGDPKLIPYGIAATIDHEAENDFESCAAVASVIQKASDKPLNGISLIRECLKPGRWCCWQSGHIEIGIDAASRKKFGMCYAIATEMLAGKFEPTVDADFVSSDGKAAAAWGKVKLVKRIGKLSFWRVMGK